MRRREGELPSEILPLRALSYGMLMKIDWPFFAIKPSITISSLCYSIFRIEPYTSCTYSCVFCYARWYRKPLPLTSPQILEAWKRLANSLRNVDLPPPFFRLSTLTEPFQEQLETRHRTSLNIMRIAHKHEVPLIVNTKSDLIGKSPWIDELLRLADKNLVLVQVSLTATDPEISKALEPNAPMPERRLKLIEYLKGHDVPVIARLQPLIPGIERPQLEAARKALDHGSLGIIVEPLRETRDGLIKVAKALRKDPEEYLIEFKWEPYVPSSSDSELLRPNLEWRREIFRELHAVISRYGRIMTICKNGLWLNLSSHDADCCQSQYIKAPHSIRETLYERLVRSRESLPNIHVLHEEHFMRYPRIIRRALKLHHNKLRKILGKKDLLNELVHYA